MIESASQGMKGPGYSDESESADNSREEQSETTSIPLSIIGDQQVQPGDVVRLKVISVNGDEGTIQVEYAHDKPAAMKGSDALAAQMDKPAPEQAPATGA